MSKTNEGKACDAVIRRIEARVGSSRHDVSLPEQERHAAPVEVVCRIGERLFAFEHTRIEPFDGHIRLQSDALVHFKPAVERLAGVFPQTESLHLIVRPKATQELKKREIGKMQQALGDWIIRTAPTLPLTPYGSYKPRQQSVRVPGVPFDVSLYRFSSVVPSGGGQLFLIALFEGDIERERAARIRRAYEKKCAQLAPWRRDGARSVLILEENDRNFTNPELVADSLGLIEQGAVERPDEIYLLSTILTKPWWLLTIRLDDYVYDDFSVWGKSLLEIDPAALDDLTGR
jgi:hypothetical protein